MKLGRVQCFSRESRVSRWALYYGGRSGLSARGCIPSRVSIVSIVQPCHRASTTCTYIIGNFHHHRLIIVILYLRMATNTDIAKLDRRESAASEDSQTAAELVCPPQLCVGARADKQQFH